MTLRSQFAKTMSAVLEADDKVVVLLGDIGVWSFRDAMARWPRRCLNIGVCEQGSIGFAAGLALGGYYPVFSSIDSFVCRRGYEFILHGFGTQRLPGLFVTVGGTSDYERLGPTHCAPDSVTLMAQIPGMHIRMPVTESTVDLAITSAVRQRQLAYIRLEESLVAQDASGLLLDNAPHLGATNGHISSGAQR